MALLLILFAAMVRSEAFLESLWCDSGKSSCPAAEETRKSMLDSPDHCESTLNTITNRKPHSLVDEQPSGKELDAQNKVGGKAAKMNTGSGLSISEKDKGHIDASSAVLNVDKGRQQMQPGEATAGPVDKGSSRPGELRGFSGRKEDREAGGGPVAAAPVEKKVESGSERPVEAAKSAQRLDRVDASTDASRDTSPEAGEKDKRPEYDWSPRTKKIVVPGEPRRVKIVRIVPVPVDKEGNPWPQT